MRLLLPLLLVVTIGCGSDDTTQQSETTNTDSQPQPNEDSARETTAPSDGAISDEQVAKLLAQARRRVSKKRCCSRSYHLVMITS